MRALVRRERHCNRVVRPFNVESVDAFGHGKVSVLLPDLSVKNGKFNIQHLEILDADGAQGIMLKPATHAFHTAKSPSPVCTPGYPAANLGFWGVPSAVRFGQQGTQILRGLGEMDARDIHRVRAQSAVAIVKGAMMSAPAEYQDRKREPMPVCGEQPIAPLFALRL